MLRVEGLRAAFATEGGPLEVLRGVDLEVARGEILGLVGASGSGKSLTAMSILGLRAHGQSLTGSVRLDGRELIGAPESELRRVRGASVGLVLQDPVSSLSPTMRVGDQIVETLEAHTGTRGEAARVRAIELLEEVGIPDPELRARFYPHQLSGGMCQRVMLAIALCCDPALLIADEATTSLDTTVQAQILRLIGGLRDSRGLAVLLISHDPAVVGSLADRIAVMEDGRITGVGTAAEVAVGMGGTPPGPAAPPAGQPGRAREPLLAVESLGFEYAASDRWGSKHTVRALDGVDLSLAPGEFLGVVGESGSGKSTLAKCLVRLIEPSHGRIAFRGRDVTHEPERRLRWMRTQMAMVFQSPLASLNPRHRVGQIVAGPVRSAVRSRAERAAMAAEAMEMVGLPAGLLDRYPDELSGGQRQRVSLARALIGRPGLLICDEPVSSLDATVRDQILELLAAIRAELELACVFISHDLGVVARICERVAVMHRGRVVEAGETAKVFDSPSDPYTSGLIAAIPRARP